MIWKTVLSSLAVIVLFACGQEDKKNNSNNGSKDSTATSQNIPAGSEDLSGCYLQVLVRDSFAASLHQEGNTVTGKLSFDNYEKDASTGTVEGQLEKGILKLIYSFQSEGMNTKMEVYFKKVGNTLIRGTGEMDTRGDTVYFTNPEKVNYAGNAGLTKLPCEDLASKYR